MFEFLTSVFKKKLIMRLNLMQLAMSQTEEGLRNKWKEGIFSEWEFYKRLWKLKGRLAMIEDILKMLGGE